eukprot:Phypoly_transcript_04861.p1 GENE.Phypoly_transcript_04861~~Phypoly_transcript_04861.p1  ORF type:complete len:499 (+),score=66.57 Phypoly_transcript_04861:541-2037(+)
MSGEYMNFITVPVTGNVPRERHAHSMCIANGSLWIFGGYSDNFSYLNDLYKFDFERSIWEKKSAKGARPTARHSHSMVPYNGALYLFAGIADGKPESGLLNDVYRYDIAEDVWRLQTVNGQVPAPRWGHTACVTESGKMLVFGGFGNTVFNDAWTLDFGTMTWALLATIGTPPRPRHLHASCIYNNEMYIIGGYGGKDNTRDFFKLSIQTGEWKQINALSDATRRRGHSAVVLGDGMYIFGGRDTVKFNDLLEFDFATQTWTTVAFEGQGPNARLFHTSVAYDGCVWIFGGFTGGLNMNDIWCLQLDSSKKRKVRQVTSEASGFGTLVNNPLFSDISFKVEDQLIKAHKCILYGKSERFARMLTSKMKEEKMDIIELPEISVSVFLCILNYIYTDTADVTAENAVDVLMAADQFMLEGLKKISSGIIIRGLSIDNAVDILHLADKYNLKDLKTKSTEIITKNWGQLPVDDMHLLVTLDEFKHLQNNNNSNNLDSNNPS